MENHDRENCCDFSYRHYTETLQKAQKTHKFLQFSTLPKQPQGRFIVLRHDVDAQISKAVKMAKIDSDLGICATFFVRVHGPYNLFREHSYNAVLRIAGLGHEIGLHYEPLFYGKHDLPLEETVLFEIDLLKKMFKLNIGSIAPHMPSLSNFKLRSIREKFNDPYLPRFFSEIKYISDSNKRWREGCMCKWIGKSDQMQIAVHPHWWNGDSLDEYLARYDVL